MSSSATTMRAIAYTAYGGPEVTKIVDLPVPTPKAGEVLIKTAAGALNPLDTYIRNGDLKMVVPSTFPQIAGYDISGVVTALGEGVTAFSVGDKVISNRITYGSGTFSEYVALPASSVARAPTSLPLEDSAALPLTALTAHQALDILEVKAGDRLLVTSGAGGVGLFAIQLGKLRGAHVTTTASSAGEALVRQYGADEVIDYKKGPLAEQVAADKRFPKVFDLVGEMDDVLTAVADGGHLVSIAGVTKSYQSISRGLGAPVPHWKTYLLGAALWAGARGFLGKCAKRNITYDFCGVCSDGQQLAYLTNLVDEGKLRVEIDSRFTFEDYAKAFERQESRRAKGKIIISVPN